MSGLTTEYMIKKSDNSIRYDILINTFHKKIKTFKIGREIYSRVFRVGESKFQIEIYPSGNTKEDKGNVSVFLRNKSDWKLKLKATYRLGHLDYDSDYDFDYSSSGEEAIEKYFDADESFGWPTLIAHQQCNYDNLRDGTFEIQVTITVLEEEVTAQRDMTGMNEGVKEALDRQTTKLSSEVDVVTEDVRELKANMMDIKEELQTMKRQQDRDMAAIKCGIGELRLSITQINAAPAVESRGRFECPMCTEEARPPMRLKQCGEGHIICDTCYARDEQARLWEGRERNQCGVCREPITGRPTALETFLGLS